MTEKRRLARMSETVSMDEKGRLVLPKNLRSASRVQAPSLLIASVRGEGRIELMAVDIAMSRTKGSPDANSLDGERKTTRPKS